MILEAFSSYLQRADPEIPATWILGRWLWERLSVPPDTAVDKVLHCEIALAQSGQSRWQKLKLVSSHDGATYVFEPCSDSGFRLLNSLYQYSMSYEQQKWARWVHTVKASDFNERYKSNP